jgi:succinate dehydrogenase / fumarate reductase, cytochrome b subunit
MVEGSPTVKARPTSPHLQVWRWHLTMAASILHRLTGMGLYLGVLILVGWALALAQGREAFDGYGALFAAWPGRLLLMLVTLSAFFHLANGIRHLAWDVGFGFKPKTAGVTAAIALGFAILATAMFWWRMSVFGAFAHG